MPLTKPQTDRQTDRQTDSRFSRNCTFSEVINLIVDVLFFKLMFSKQLFPPVGRFSSGFFFYCFVLFCFTVKNGENV